MVKKKNIFLILLLVFAFCVNFYPHLNYKYPIHVDEWENFIRTRSISDSQSTTYRDLHLGKTKTNNLEIGMGVFLATLHKVTGNWLLIFRFLPAFLSSILVLSVFILFRKQNFGLEAAFFVALIPTTVRLLGPAFLVPVSLGLLFIPLSLFIVFYKKHYKIPLFLFSLFLLYLHPPTAMASFIILGIYSLLNLKSKRKKSLFILSILVLSFFLYTPYLYPQLISRGTSAATFSGGVVFIKSVLEYIGIVTTGFFILGVYFISLKMEKKKLTILFSTISIFVLLVIFRYYEKTFFIMPTRAYMYLMLLMSMIAGYTLSKFKKIKIFFVLLIILAAFFGIQNINSQPYYHIINDKDYQAFKWIEQNTPKNSTAILHPWKAITFPAISGRTFYSYIPRGPIPFYARRNQKIQVFFQNNCKNTEFLIQNNISIIYPPGQCNNTQLTNPYDNIYILKNH